MKQKLLFENRGGNRFKLLTENQQVNESLVNSGLKKVFINADGDIPYKRVESVGLGYIKDVSTAYRVALKEARDMAESFGYKDDEDNAKFVKEQNDFSKLDAQNPSHDLAKVGSDEVGHEETSNTGEENREVQIGKEIISLTQPLVNKIDKSDWAKYVTPIQTLAKELIKMHGK